MKKVYCLFFGRVIIALISAITLLTVAKAQIVTRILSPGTIEKYGIKELAATSQLPTFRLPDIDLNAELKKDSLDNLLGKPMRFGKSFQVNVDVMAAGKQFRSSDSLTTVYAITSQRATSINLTFDRFKLAKGATLYIYTTDKRVLYGPVTDAHNPDSQTFWTDVLPGTGIVIQVTAPVNGLQASELHIATAIHGYTKAFLGYGSAISSLV